MGGHSGSSEKSSETDIEEWLLSSFAMPLQVQHKSWFSTKQHATKSRACVATMMHPIVFTKPHTHVRAHTRMHACIARVRTYMQTHTYMHIHAHMKLCSNIYTCTHMQTHIYAHAGTHICTHAAASTHVSLCVCCLLLVIVWNSSPASACHALVTSSNGHIYHSR